MRLRIDQNMKIIYHITHSKLKTLIVPILKELVQEKNQINWLINNASKPTSINYDITLT